MDKFDSDKVPEGYAFIAMDGFQTGQVIYGIICVAGSLWTRPSIQRMIHVTAGG